MKAEFGLDLSLTALPERPRLEAQWRALEARASAS
ncbi:MAG: hypothetical protein RL654_3481, partial [Pseudomonadota bacterium]